MANKIDYRNVFQSSAAEYEEITASKHIRLIYELEKEMLDELFKETGSTDRSVMDFACGSGRWTQYLENKFAECIGVDVSKAMVTVAESKCQRAKFIVTDITAETVDEQIKDKRFDVITAFRFFKNAEQDLRTSVVAKLPKYLKDDGLFIFDVHLNTWSFMGLLARIIDRSGLEKILKTGHLTIRTMSLGDVKRLFEDSDLEIADFWGMGLLPGRSNYTLLPWKWLKKFEGYFTKRKLLRSVSYNLLIVARKKKTK
ncbi:MAG TPA: class I SAM-dependent methyltransferase [Phycisphaerales bacterium]|nr:class I SAM-dependent methyltransferase [Phycisphaerales bacterium]